MSSDLRASIIRQATLLFSCREAGATERRSLTGGWLALPACASSHLADFNTAPLMEVELANINDIPKSKDKEQKVPDLESQAISVGRKAFGIDEFCQLFGVGRTTTYSEIKVGRLRARKVGARTIIAADDANNWLQSLPHIRAKP